MPDLSGYRLTFDEEFNTLSVSQTGQGTTWADIRSQWRYDQNSDIGFGRSSFLDPASGYDPFRVGGGALTITASPDGTDYGYPGSWESGLLTTQGNFSQTYGYFEVRADFSHQTGAWDAFWLVADTPIPSANGGGGWQELDVVERYGNAPADVYSTIHTTDPQNGVPWQQNRQVFSKLAQPDGYHTYGMDWQADTIGFYVDGKLVGSQATPSDMHGPMHLLLDLAVESADKTGTALDPAISSRIDYVRAYSADPNAIAVQQSAVSDPDGEDPGLRNAVSAPVCFITGTLIRTVGGEVAVEDLRVGDRAVTASGYLRPIVWIGHHDLDGHGRALPHDQQPVRIRANAFGPGLPARTLRLSPGHPVLVGADEDGGGGHLVPVMCLINGTTISREPATAVTYWHVELDAHDILLAEGLAAESYLDWGDRPFFAEGSDHALYNPDFVVPGLSARCRPVAVEGAVVEAERARLAAVFAGELAGHGAWDEGDSLAWL